MTDYTVFNMITDMIEKASGVTVAFINNTPEALQHYDPFLSQGLSRLNFDHFEEEKLYCIEDAFLVHTVILRQKSPTAHLMIAGPFLTQEITEESLIQIMASNHMHPGSRSALLEYYHSLPLASLPQVRYYVGSAGRFFYGNAIRFEIISLTLTPTHSHSPSPVSLEDQFAPFRQIETLYDLERKLFWEIEHGNRKEALETYENLRRPLSKNLAPETQLRSAKCYSHVLNTLARKAAQSGGVHISLLHPVFEQFLHTIDHIMTTEELHETNLLMLNNYLTLVQNLSMKGYSKSIKQVAAFILTNLGAELNISLLAQLVNLSPPYLSSLFKKDTGMTLSEFITQKRMDCAMNLLSRSGMQIQEIALYLGYQDPSYFSRVFHKQTGITPQQYRSNYKIVENNSQP